jgi:hypothetical protein
MRSIRASVAILTSIIALGASLNAQIYTEIGGGGGTGSYYWGQINIYNPLTDWYYTTRHIYMIRASELLAFGASPGLTLPPKMLPV